MFNALLTRKSVYFFGKQFGSIYQNLSVCNFWLSNSIQEEYLTVVFKQICTSYNNII